MSNGIISSSGDFMDAPGALVQGSQIMQRVGNQYATAIGVQRPRDLNLVKRKVCQEAELAGESMYYSWSVKNQDGSKSSIEGPSIKLAMTIARNFGNCVAGCVEEVEDTPSAWIFTGSFIDLETGFNFVRKFRQSKGSKVHMKTDDERKDDIRFQIGQSKAIRNAVIASVPDAIIEQAITAAKSGVTRKIEDAIKVNKLPAVQDAAIAALKKLGVDEEAILSRHSIADRKALTVEHLVLMHGDIRTIQDGVERADALYPPVKEEESSQTKSVKESVKKPEVAKKAKKEPAAEEVAPDDKVPDATHATPQEEVVPESGPGEAGEAPDWFEKRKAAYNSHNSVDRMRLPIAELVQEWKKAQEPDKVWWSALVADATEHALKLCTKVSVVPMTTKLVRESLKGFDEDLTKQILAKFEAKQAEMMKTV